MNTKREPKPSGWKGTKESTWYTKDSAYGVRYMCPVCGKKNLGIGERHRMHFNDCPNLTN